MMSVKCLMPLTSTMRTTISHRGLTVLTKAWALGSTSTLLDLCLSHKSPIQVVTNTTLLQMVIKASQSCGGWSCRREKIVQKMPTIKFAFRQSLSCIARPQLPCSTWLSQSTILGKFSRLIVGFVMQQGFLHCMMLVFMVSHWLKSVGVFGQSMCLDSSLMIIWRIRRWFCRNLQTNHWW